MSYDALPIGQLRFLGDPALRVVCARVEQSDAALMNLVKAMQRVALDWRASGLAANQVGGTHRVILAGIRGRGYVTMVNPRIVGARGPLTLFTEEGCLSLATFRTSTRRHAFVTVEWQGLGLGATRHETFTGYEAQVIQHEIDHLDGKLLIDGLSRQQRRQAERAVFEYLAEKAS